MQSLTTAARVGACCLAWLAFAGRCQAAPRPNILMVVVDDLPDEMCNFLGGNPARNQTPNIDRLAAEGLVLSGMHSPAPICTPSRFAILTGRYPSRSTSEGFRREADRCGQSVVRFDTLIGSTDDTLPRRLQQAGYATAAFGKNHVVEASGYQRLPYTASVETPAVCDILAHNARALREAFRGIGFDWADRLYFGNPDADGVRALAVHNQDWITEGALEFLHRKHDKPFFLYVATTVPHGPFDDDRSWNADRRITPEGILPEPPTLHSSADTLAVRTAVAGLAGGRRKTLLWLDDAIGALLAAIDDAGYGDNTILIFVSDHGTGAKGSLYARGTTTPCFFWRRGGFGRHKLATSASLVDLAPTLLDWAGITIEPAAMDGTSLAPAIEGKTEEVHESLYFELGFSRAVQRDGLKYLAVRYPSHARTMPADERSRILEANNAWLARRGRPIATHDPLAPFSHLSLIPGGNDAERISMNGYPAYFEPDQLYDLRVDPSEQHNLFDDPAYTDRRTALRRLLNDAVSNLADRFGEFGTPDFEP